MEYVLHYANGAEGYLAHSGVKGMKWGKWNAETAARYGNVKTSHNRTALKSEKAFWKSQAAYATGNKAKGDSLYKKHVKLEQKEYDRRNKKAINDKANEYWKVRKRQGKNAASIKMVDDYNKDVAKSEDNKIFYDAVFRKYGKKEAHRQTMKNAAVGGAVGAGAAIVRVLL